MVKAFPQPVTSFTPLCVSPVTIHYIVEQSINNCWGLVPKFAILDEKHQPLFTIMSWVTAARCNYSHRLKAHRMNGCPNYLLSWKPIQRVGKQFGNKQLFKGPSLRGVV